MNASDNILKMDSISKGKRVVGRLSDDATTEKHAFAATFYRGVLGEAEDQARERAERGED